MANQKWIPIVSSILFTAAAIFIMVDHVTVSWPAITALGIVALFIIVMFALHRDSASKVEVGYKGAKASVALNGVNDPPKRVRKTRKKAESKVKDEAPATS